MRKNSTLEFLIHIINQLYELKIQDYVNTIIEKQHEIQVENIFKQNNYKLVQSIEIDIIDKLKNINNKNTIIKELKNQFLYLPQPFGSQNSPDFIICVDGFILWLECKSGKNKITWNTGYPIPETLYIFSCRNKNTSTLFLGRFSELLIKNPAFDYQYREFDVRMKSLCKEYFSESFISDNFSFYMRRMLNDKTKYSCPLLREEYYNSTIQYFNNVLKKCN